MPYCCFTVALAIGSERAVLYVERCLSADGKAGAFALEILLSPFGDFLRKRAQRSLAIAIICEIAVVLIVVLSSYSRLPVRAWLGDYDTTLAVTAVFPALGAYHYHNVYRRTKQGMEGEKRVTQFLKSKFDDSYFLINDVVYVNERGNKENIDHIVLGPNGIFAIETGNNIASEDTVRQGRLAVIVEDRASAGEFIGAKGDVFLKLTIV